MALFKKTENGAGEASAPKRIGADLSFAGAEAYNVLRTNIKFAFPGKEGCRVIGMTSSVPMEGKSLTTINLGYTLAKDNMRTLIISGDMRKPSLERYMNIETGTGLSNLLSGNMTDGNPGIRNILHPNLFILTSGEIPPNPSELIGSKMMEKLLTAARKSYDYILVDLPPVSSVIDAIAVSKFVDGMLVVIKHGYAHRQTVSSVINELRYADAKIIGFVYNCYDAGTAGYSRKKYYKKYYKEYYQQQSEPKPNKE